MPTPTPALLVLDGATCPEALTDAVGGDVHQAASPLEAAAILVRRRCGLVLVDLSFAWHRTFARTLPHPRGVTVIAVGDTAQSNGHVDGWLPAEAHPEETERVLAEAGACARVRAAQPFPARTPPPRASMVRARGEVRRGAA